MRAVALKNVHRGEQITVRVADKRRGAERMPGKRIDGIVGVQIVDNRADRFPCMGKAHGAFSFAECDIKFIVGIGF